MMIVRIIAAKGFSGAGSTLVDETSHPDADSPNLTVTSARTLKKRILPSVPRNQSLSKTRAASAPEVCKFETERAGVVLFGCCLQQAGFWIL